MRKIFNEVESESKSDVIKRILNFSPKIKNSFVEEYAFDEPSRKIATEAVKFFDDVLEIVLKDNQDYKPGDNRFFLLFYKKKIFSFVQKNAEKISEVEILYFLKNYSYEFISSCDLLFYDIKKKNYDFVTFWNEVYCYVLTSYLKEMIDMLADKFEDESDLFLDSYTKD
jgi:hypothetical protein